MVMAVLPASNRLNLQDIRMEMEVTHLEMLEESLITKLFPDCEQGAIPPLGRLYGMEVWVDRAISDSEHIVFLRGHPPGLHPPAQPIPTQAALALETALLQYANGGSILNPDDSLDAPDGRIGERPPHRAPDGPSCQASAPKRRIDLVAELGDTMLGVDSMESTRSEKRAFTLHSRDRPPPSHPGTLVRQPFGEERSRPFQVEDIVARRFVNARIGEDILEVGRVLLADWAKLRRAKFECGAGFRHVVPC